MKYSSSFLTGNFDKSAMMHSSVPLHNGKSVIFSRRNVPPSPPPPPSSLYFNLKGYSSDQSHFSETNVKLAGKNKYATHSVQRSLEMCENK